MLGLPYGSALRTLLYQLPYAAMQVLMVAVVVRSGGKLALDRLLVFDKGKIVEEGNHEQLIRLNGGIYRRLFERQALELTKGLVA